MPNHYINVDNKYKVNMNNRILNAYAGNPVDTSKDYISNGNTTFKGKKVSTTESERPTSNVTSQSFQKGKMNEKKSSEYIRPMIIAGPNEIVFSEQRNLVEFHNYE